MPTITTTSDELRHYKTWREFFLSRGVLRWVKRFSVDRRDDGRLTVTYELSQNY